MPEISEFYGIKICMYFDDHSPPHFHAAYGEYKIIIEINDFSILSGILPPRALGLVMEWASVHKEDLIEEWRLAKNKNSLFKIEPLS